MEKEELIKYVYGAEYGLSTLRNELYKKEERIERLIRIRSNVTGCNIDTLKARIEAALKELDRDWIEEDRLMRELKMWTSKLNEEETPDPGTKYQDDPNIGTSTL